MKRLPVLFLAALLIAGSACGCGYRKKGEIGDNEKVIGNIVLNPDPAMTGSLKLAAPNVSSHVAAVESFIQSFNKKFPNIKVDAQYMELGTYKTAVGNAASAGEKKPETMYDVFWLPQDFLNDWYSLNILSSLDTLIEKDAAVSKDLLVEQAVESSSVNGKMYMMPRDFNQVVMYYNKAMFRIADVDEPTARMTGEEFRQMCIALRDGLASSKEKNDYGMTYESVVQNIVDCNVCWDSMCWPLIKSFGGSVVNEKGEVTFDSEESLNAIKYWRSLVQDKSNGCQLAITLSVGGNSSGTQFKMQQAPIYFQARAVLGDLVNPGEMAGQEVHGISELGVASMPNFGGTYAVGGGCSGYAMYRNTVHGTEAWQFLKHVSSVEGQEAYSATGGCVPVLKSFLADKNATWRHCLPDKLVDFDHEAFIEGMDDAYTSTRDFYKYIPLAAQTDVLSAIEEAFNAIVPMNNEATMVSTLKEKADKMRKYITIANNGK